MINWRQFPLLRLIFPVIAGILAGFLPDQPSFLPGWVFACLFLPVLLLCRFAIRMLPYSFRWVPGASVWVLLSLLFFGLAVDRHSLNFDSALMRRSVPERMFVAELMEPPQEKKNSFKTVVRLLAYCDQGIWKSAGANCLVYLKKSHKVLLLGYGHRILFSGRLAEPATPGNPGSFDYRRYLLRRGIGFSIYLDDCHWRQLCNSGGNPVLRLAISARDRLLELMLEHQLSGQSFAVAAALLLGYTGEIDADTYRDYGATGAMHILSVSGMHVGIIFLVLEFLLSPLKKRKWGVGARALLIIVCIWGYAFITGLSPAVLRASVMLSLIVIGKSIKRQPDLFNILAASAIALLIYDPLLLTDAGFQLSYLAVAGILLFFQPLCTLIFTGKPVLDKLMALIAVSVSAQLATFPLGLWYFHQFPNFFLLTNLVVVPLSALIIYTGIALLTLYWVPLLTGFLASLLTFLLRFLNGSIHWIGTLPGSVTGGVYLTLPAVFAVFGFIIALFIGFSTRRKYWIVAALVVLLFLSSERFFESMKSSNTCRMIVYKVKEGLLIDFINGGRAVLVGELRLLGDPITASMITSSRSSAGFRERYRIHLQKMIRTCVFIDGNCFAMMGDCFRLGAKRIILIRDDLPLYYPNSIHADLLVITGKANLKMETVRNHFPGCIVIVDASVPAYRESKWTEEAKKLGMSIYSVRRSGAFVADF